MKVLCGNELEIYEVLQEVKRYFVEYDGIDTFKLASLLVKIDRALLMAKKEGA